MTHDEIIDKAFRVFGDAARKEKAIEECLELALKLVHEKDGKANVVRRIEEKFRRFEEVLNEY